MAPPKVENRAASASSGADATASTRLYVQNLPAYVDSARLRTHFAAQGEVTDACVIRTKDGKKSRRFGFVGFKTVAQAEQALRFFDKSFFDTCRLNVRIALTRDSDEMARPWSKYAAGSSRFQNQHKEGVPVTEDAVQQQDGATSKTKSGDGRAELNANPEFQDFMETMQARSKSRFWANDDAQGPDAASKIPSGSRVDGDGSGDDSDDEYQELDANVAEATEEKKEAMSDMDFLRSKVNKSLDRESSDAEVGGEKEYEEDIEVDDEDDNKPARTSAKATRTSGGVSEGGGASVPGSAEPTSRLFVRNLPFTAIEEDLTELFGKYGQVTEMHMPLDDTKRRKGYGFVSYKTTVDAQAALTALNGFAFQGRLLHVIYATGKPEKQNLEAALEDPSLTYKQKKELERQINATKQTGWNASFIRGDATVGSLAERMGVKRGDIMDKEQGNMAVRLAIGETMLVKENKDFFAQEGVDLNAIEGALVKKPGQAAAAAAKQKVERSTTVILVKNLPHTTDEDELAQLFRKHGDIGRFLLPPSKTLALVEYFEPSEARKAFRSLAYKKYQHVPLYLEWAPVKVFTQPKASSAQQTQQKGIKTTAVVPQADDADDVSAEAANNTICVKNLNFSTTESSLEKLFKQCGPVRKVTVARRKDPKRGLLSMGFGFVEFANAKHADQALTSLQSAVVDGHALNLKISHKTQAGAKRKTDAAAAGGKSRSKIIVRNVAFEATTQEIRELFAAFGQLKRVRMPKKFDGKHRGFAFVDFLTEQEAQTAFSALSSSHLYGRHLVLEWAEDADDMDTLRAKATKDLSAITAAESDRRKRRKQADDEGDDDEEF